jgi:hypothetical protein
MSWIGSWGELVSLGRVAHGQQRSTGDCQQKDDSENDDEDLQNTLLRRQPDERLDLYRSRPHSPAPDIPPIGGLTAPIGTHMYSWNAGKGSQRPLTTCLVRYRDRALLERWRRPRAVVPHGGPRPRPLVVAEGLVMRILFEVSNQIPATG